VSSELTLIASILVLGMLVGLVSIFLILDRFFLRLALEED